MFHRALRLAASIAVTGTGLSYGGAALAAQHDYPVAFQTSAQGKSAEDMAEKLHMPVLKIGDRFFALAAACVPKRMVGSAADDRHLGSAEDGRHLGSGEEGRHLGSAESGRRIASAEAGRHLGSAEEGRHLGSATDGRHLGSAEDGRHHGSAEDGRHFGAEETALRCRLAPDGFTVIVTGTTGTGTAYDPGSMSPLDVILRKTAP